MPYEQAGAMLLITVDGPDAAKVEHEYETIGEMCIATNELGGKISGEHGIGHKRKKYMPLVVSREYIDMMRAIKRAMDPNNVLNPGKIFD